MSLARLLLASPPRHIVVYGNSPTNASSGFLFFCIIALDLDIHRVSLLPPLSGITRAKYELYYDDLFTGNAVRGFHDCSYLPFSAAFCLVMFEVNQNIPMSDGVNC